MTTLLLRKLRFGAAGLLFAFTTQSGLAQTSTNSVGLEVTYAAVPNDTSTYELTLKYYSTCMKGIGTAFAVHVRNPGCSPMCMSTYHNLPLDTIREVSDVCPGALTTCDSAGSLLFGVREAVFKKLVTFNCSYSSQWWIGMAPPWRLSTVNLDSVQTLNEMLADAYLNRAGGLRNSSPQFMAKPILYACVNDTVTYNAMAVDPDGDSLVFKLTSPRGGDNGCYIYDQFYQPGYTYLQPFGASPLPTTLDPVTGQLQFMATAPGRYAVGYLTEEYRTINGVVTKVGNVNREMQIVVTSCTTPCPLFGNVLSTGNGAMVNSNAQATVNPGASVELSIPAYSTNPNVTLQMTSNCANEIPGSSFTVTGTGANRTGVFHWAPTAADVRSTPYYFTYHVKDNACPVSNQRYGTLKVLVTNALLGTQGMSVPDMTIPSSLSNGEKWVLPENLHGAQITVFDLTGRAVFHSGAYTNQFSGTGLSNGVYLFHIIPRGSESPITGQLRLQH
jgi:hypothetical protein